MISNLKKLKYYQNQCQKWKAMINKKQPINLTLNLDSTLTLTKKATNKNHFSKSLMMAIALQKIKFKPTLTLKMKINRKSIKIC